MAFGSFDDLERSHGQPTDPVHPGGLPRSDQSNLHRNLVLEPALPLPLDPGRTPSGSGSTWDALVEVTFELDRAASKPAGSIVSTGLNARPVSDLIQWLDEVPNRPRWAAAGAEAGAGSRRGASWRDPRILVGSADLDTAASTNWLIAGSEQLKFVSYEPAFAIDVAWTLLNGIHMRRRTSGYPTYLRLSTRPVNQLLAAVPADPAAREQRRRQVIAGVYSLRRAERPMVTLVGMGTTLTETLTAAERLAHIGVQSDVVSVTSVERLFAAVQARRGSSAAPLGILDEVFPACRAAPMVILLDGHPQRLAFLATVNNVPGLSLGTGSRAGRAGTAVHGHKADVGDVVRAALDLIG